MDLDELLEWFSIKGSQLWVKQVEEGPDEGANYYRNLKHYTPICYSGRGVPFFLVNHNYYTSLPCIVCVNLVLLLGIVLAFVNAKNSNKS